MGEQQVAALLAKTAQGAERGEFELLKTTPHFDETAKHPNWLGPDSVPVQEIEPSQSG